MSLSDKLASYGAEFLMDGGCCSDSEVALFVVATDLNQKTLSEKKGKLLGFVATKMTTKAFKVNTVEKKMLDKVPLKVHEALQSFGVEHELVVKLVKVYSSEEVEAKLAADMERVNQDYANKSFFETHSRSALCMFFNTTGYQLKLVSASVTFGKRDWVKALFSFSLLNRLKAIAGDLMNDDGMVMDDHIGANLVLGRQHELLLQLLNHFRERELTGAKFQNDAARAFYFDCALGK